MICFSNFRPKNDGFQSINDDFYTKNGQFLRKNVTNDDFYTKNGQFLRKNVTKNRGPDAAAVGRRGAQNNRGGNWCVFALKNVMSFYYQNDGFILKNK